MVYQKHIFCTDEPVKNVEQDGKIIGFTLKMKYPSYRGMYLSYIEDILVIVDGVEYHANKGELNVTLVNGTWEYDQFFNCGHCRWDFNEKGSIFVKKPDGIAHGKHRVEAGMKIRGYFGMMCGGGGYGGGYADFEI